VLFNIFDVYGNGSLPFPQWHVFVISFIQAYCRLVDKPFPKRSKLERVAKLVLRIYYSLLFLSDFRQD